jgi:DUF4097 and DUF4098 domain-containing protein YvlB
MKEHHLEEALEEGEAKLHVTVEVGEVDIRSHDKRSVVVDAETEHMVLSLHRDENNIYLRVENEDGESHRDTLTRLIKNVQPRAVVRIRIPASCEVRAKTVTGSLSVSGIDAPTATHVITGKTNLDQLGGPISAKTVSGSVYYRGLLAEERHRFKATTGKVHLELTETPDARVDARITTGQIRCGLPMKEQVERRNVTGARLRGTLGSGKGDIRARVVTGNLTIASV